MKKTFLVSGVGFCLLVTLAMVKYNLDQSLDGVHRRLCFAVIFSDYVRYLNQRGEPPPSLEAAEELTPALSAVIRGASRRWGSVAVSESNRGSLMTVTASFQHPGSTYSQTHNTSTNQNILFYQR